MERRGTSPGRKEKTEKAGQGPTRAPEASAVMGVGLMFGSAPRHPLATRGHQQHGTVQRLKTLPWLQVALV